MPSTIKTKLPGTPRIIRGRSAGSKLGDRLSRREREVLFAVIRGKSSQEIADDQYVSKRTVDFHLANIYAKWDVNNKLQMFWAAQRRGYLTIQFHSEHPEQEVTMVTDNS